MRPDEPALERFEKHHDLEIWLKSYQRNGIESWWAIGQKRELAIVLMCV